VKDAIATWESDGGRCVMPALCRLNAWDAGTEAAQHGAPIWMNPHMRSPSDEKGKGLMWLAGWCKGMREST
jgi:hypothetical protein